MTIKEGAQRVLKRFLQRKGGFREVVLVAFLISGFAVFGAEQIEKKNTLSEKKIIKEVEPSSLKDEEFLFEIDPSEELFQISFSGTHKNSGKKKSKTSEEFEETIRAAEDFYGIENGGRVDNMTIEELLTKGNGSIIDDRTYWNSIEFVADQVVIIPNQPGATPKLPVISVKEVTIEADEPTVTLDRPTITANQTVENPDKPGVGVNQTIVSPSAPIVTTIIAPNQGAGVPNDLLSSPNVSTGFSSPTINIGALAETAKPIVAATPDLPQVTPLTFSAPAGVSVSVEAPEAVEKIVINSPATGVPTAPTEKVITITPPALPESYEIEIKIDPVIPGVINTPTIVVLTPPTLVFGGGGFAQFDPVRMPKNGIIMENYDTYTTDTQLVINTGNESGDYTTWSGGTVTTTTTQSGPPLSLAPGSTNSRLNAFISSVKDHSPTFSGDYKMTDGGRSTSPKIFLSYNPAGVGNNSFGGTNDAGSETGKFDGTLELHGVEDFSTNSVLIGVEYQLWGSGTHDDSYTIFENAGTITLASGNKVIGIAINIESQISADKNNPYKMVNSGKIIINNKNSVGVDFTNFNNHDIYVDVALGDIEVNGSNNYGLRMGDIRGDDYYDRVTITSGGTDKKITVGGTQNVGISLVKSLEDSVSSNPVNNFSGINIEVTGDQVVGILRHESYDANNVNDMILDAATMGKITFGSGATDSTLIRSDKYGIQIAKDIDAASGDTGNSFAQATKTGTITNKAVLSSSLDSFTGLISSGANSKVVNEGTLKITGSDSVGIAIVDGGSGVNKGSIELKGTESGKVGIYNTGNFSLDSGSVLTVQGAESTGVYNTKTLDINGVVKIDASNGGTALYGNGGTINYATTSGSSLSITVDDTAATGAPGVGVYGKNGATINLKNANIDVDGGTAGIVAKGSTTNIDLSGGSLKYNGEGYAIYTEDGGKVNMTNSTLTLGGTAVGFELDTTNPAVTISGTEIIMMSNDAVVANIKNPVDGVITGLNNLLLGILGVTSGDLVITSGTVDGVTYDNYTVAYVENVALTFDSDTDKYSKDTATDGYFYARRFEGNRLRLIVGENVTVNATTDSSYATEFFDNQVVGLEANSTKAATSSAENKIVLNQGAKIIANRTDTGNGAVGAFINYGQVSTATGSSITVEKIDTGVAGDTSNKSGVGIYAVNGSSVNVGTDSSVNVYGDEGVGIVAMAQREDSAGDQIVDEFGPGAAGQGTISVTNAGNITLDGKGSVGIYGMNNNAAGTKADAIITNTGVITVNDSIATASSVGIYGDKVTIDNKGTIDVGVDGVAIYAVNNSEIKGLGTIKLGDGGVGVVFDRTTNITGTSVTFIDSAAGGTKGRTGIIYEGPSADSETININIDSSNLTDGTALYVKGMNLTSGGTLFVGKGGTGLYVTVGSSATNTGTINLKKSDGTASIDTLGMYTKGGTLTNTGTINVEDGSSIGIYGEGSTTVVANTGTINVKDGSTGIFLNVGATHNLTDGGIVFGTADPVSSGIGIFAENNSKVNINEDITITSNNQDKNILVYSKDSSVANSKILTIDGVGSPATSGNKTVGLYLENNSTGSTYTGTGTGAVNVKNEAVGIYSKGINTLKNVVVNVDGGKTTGAFLDGGSKIDGTATVINGGVGIYGASGKIDVTSGNLTLKTTTGVGTGMYLTDGAYATTSVTGGKIVFKNTAADQNIGLYYTKGTGTTAITHSIALELTGSKGIGIYSTGGLDLTNTTNINSTGTTSGNIGVFVGGSSKYTSTGNISLVGVNDIGIYVEKGESINNGTITLTGTPTTTGIGMVSKSIAGGSSKVVNKGTIVSNGNLGMYVSGLGTSIGENKGTITTTIAAGVYLDGTGNSTNVKFDGTGGTINADKLGIYLKNIGANAVTSTGTLKIGTGGVGVFAEGSEVGFSIDTSVSTEEVALVAKGSSKLAGAAIKAGSGSIGVYILDDGVTFSGSNSITTKAGTGSKTSVGVYLADTLGAATQYALNNVNINAQDGVGVYLGNNTTGSTGANVKFDGTISVETVSGKSGIGIYVPEYTKLTTGVSTLNIDGGVGVYIKGGAADIGNNGAVTLNFEENGGIGIYNDGGALTLGNNVVLSGDGTLVAVLNGSLTSNGTFNIGEATVGIIGRYNDSLTTSETISNGGTITAASGVIAVGAVDEGTAGLGTGGAVSIKNTGTINLSGKSAAGTPTIGIYTDIGNVVNEGTINVGTDGIGIYTAYNSTDTSIDNKKLVMTGTNGVGVYIKGKTKGFVSNKITSTGSKNTGVALDNIGTFSGNLNVGTITLGNESSGVYATGDTTATIDGAITIGAGSDTRNSVGLAVNKGAKVTLGSGSETASINVGAKGIGVSGEGAATTITITDGAKVTAGSEGLHYYIKDAALTVGGTTTVDGNLGIFAEGGTIALSNMTLKNGGLGVYLKGNMKGFTSGNITSTEAGTTAIVLDNIGTSIGTLGAGTITLGSESTGIFAKEGTATTINGSITVGAGSDTKNSVGILANSGAKITVGSTGSIDAGSKGIGVYGEGAATVVTITNGAGVTAGSEGIHYYIKGATLNAGGTTTVNDSVGVFAEGGRVNLLADSELALKSGGLGVYLKGNMEGFTSSKIISTETDTTGIVLDNIGTSIGTLDAGTITLGNESNGVHVLGDTTTIIDGSITVGAGSDTKSSAGLIASGGAKVTLGTGSGDISIGAGAKSVGVYGAGAATTVTVIDGADVTTGSKGTHYYIKDAALTVGGTSIVDDSIGVYAEGGTVTLSNTLVKNGGLGVYLKGSVKGFTSTKISSTETDIVGIVLDSIGIFTGTLDAGTVTLGDESTGVYATGSMTTTVDGTITVGAGSATKNSVGLITKDGAKLTLAGSASIDAGAKGIGVYAEGSGTTVTVTDGAGVTAGADGIHYYVKGSALTVGGTTAVDGNIGVVADGGTVNLTNTTLENSGIGVYLKGNLDGFTSAKISSLETDTTGIVLDNAGVFAGTLNTGVITLGAESSGIFAMGDTTATIDGSITVGAGSDTKNSAGVIASDGAKLTLAGSTSIDAGAKGIGVYAEGADTTVTVTNGAGVTAGTDGIHYYVKGSALTVGGTTTVDDSVGIYAEGGTVTLSNMTLKSGGLGVYLKGSVDGFTSTKISSAEADTTGLVLDSIGTSAETLDAGTIALSNESNGIFAMGDTTATIDGSITVGAGSDTKSSAGLIANDGAKVTLGSAAGEATIDTGAKGIGVYAEGAATVVTVTDGTGIKTGTDGIHYYVKDAALNVGGKTTVDDSIGVYAEGGTINLLADSELVLKNNGVGVYLKGSMVGFISSKISSTETDTTGLVLDNVGTPKGILDAGTITLGDESTGIFAAGGTATVIKGTITVGDGSDTKNSAGLIATDGAEITLRSGSGEATIDAGSKGIGVYAEGSATEVTVTDGADITTGTDGIHFYVKGATLSVGGSISADDSIGIYAEGGTVNLLADSKIKVENGGIGLYLKGTAPTFATTTIDLKGGSEDNYSIGAYYDDVTLSGSVPTINQTGSYNIGVVMDNTSVGTMSTPTTIGSAASTGQIGIAVKKNSNLTLNNSITVNGGSNNVGIYSEDSTVAVTGDISVSSGSGKRSNESISTASTGVFLSGSNYTGTGDITVGDYSVGMVGQDLIGGNSITQTGTTMTVGEGGVGISGEGTGDGTENINVTMDNIVLSNNNSIGIYGNNINTTLTGDMEVGTNSGLGVVSEGNGDVTYSGRMTIADKAGSSSIGIYKNDGSGTITASSTSSFDVGAGGYGIYIKQNTGKSATVNFDGTMDLKEASIGIYSESGNIINNRGTIDVGTTKLGVDPLDPETRISSIGMYLGKGTKSTNSGTITVDERYSIGVYAIGEGTTFSNAGIIDVSNGGIGIVVEDGAVARNEGSGVINLSDDEGNIGMGAFGSSQIINEGTINVNDGSGMAVGTGSELTNVGTITVSNGTGISGDGIVINTGTIKVTDSGRDIVSGTGGIGSIVVDDAGSVTINNDGSVTINDNYVSIGGILETSGDLIIDGAHVDITTGLPMFSADSVTGEVDIMGNFATIGNGISYEIKDFIDTASGLVTGDSLTPTTSPLFFSKITDDGSLVIVKRPYSDLTIGEQFKSMEDGLDDLLANDPYGKDGDALKDLNQYLEDLPENQFASETARTLGEMRGDIYSTVQERITDIDKSFDVSFNELLNTDKIGAGKFSVMYSGGDYEDQTVGVTDYNYNLSGIFFMDEFEGGKKSGYSLGFAYTDFSFDDSGSDENVYSLRGGIHKVIPITNNTELTTRLELGYNRHRASRKILLDQMYENVGRYNSYGVTLDNKLSNNLILNSDSKLGVYAALNLKVDKIDDISEDGTIELEVDTNDYVSSKLVVGVEGSKEYYLGKAVSLKLNGGVNYSYELGENINDNRARVKDSDEDYYDLISPGAEEGKLIGVAGVALETNSLGVSFTFEAENDRTRDELSTTYNLQFKYKL